MTVRTIQLIMTLLIALFLSSSSAQSYDLQGLIPGGLRGIGSLPYSGAASSVVQLWHNRQNNKASASASTAAPVPAYKTSEQTNSAPTDTATPPTQLHSASVQTPALGVITPAPATPVPEARSTFSAPAPAATGYSLCSIGGPKSTTSLPGMTSRDFFNIFLAPIRANSQSESFINSCLALVLRLDRNIIASTQYFTCSTKEYVLIAGRIPTARDWDNNKFAFVKKDGQFVLSSITVLVDFQDNPLQVGSPAWFSCTPQPATLKQQYGQPKEVISERATSYIWHDGVNVIILTVPIDTDWGTLRITTPELMQLESEVEN